ncbi:MAG: hypothetical protein SFU86_06455 [Pirellulaceae bacterium]|nr:hypothetical protein [Pirellulaceae bacterium]
MDAFNDTTYATEPARIERDELQPVADLYEYLREYTRERPEVVALACFGIGFVLGWKLKPW